MRRSRKLLPAKSYKTMTLRLQHLTTQMIETSTKGFRDTIELLKTDVFKVKRNGRLWEREGIHFLNQLERRKTSLMSTLDHQKGKAVSRAFIDMFLVARPELRQGWTPPSKWEKFVDVEVEQAKLTKTISSDNSQADLFTFRACFLDVLTSESECTWCGNKFSSNRHVFFYCEHAKTFWQEYYRRAFANYRSCLETLAKSYLFVCQKLGVLPIHSEHWSQVLAKRNSRLFLWNRWTRHIGYLESRWLHCPLPPPIGL